MIRSLRRLRVASSLAIVALGLAIGVGAVASPASAAVNTHCNATSYFPAGYLCPNIPNGNRHTYKSGRAASGATSGAVVSAIWYVAYTSSNASSPKYYDQGPVGAILYSSFPANTQLLRGYASHNAGGPLYGEGSY